MPREIEEDSPCFSIITVVYNSVNLIERTIQSILSQSSTNYEYIIIDGGSDDGTLEIIKKYQDKVKYWVSEKDRGIYDAMNKGIKVANGKFLWFINSGDEIFSSGTLAKLTAIAPEADVIYGETMLINEDKKSLGTRSELTTRKLPKQLTWKSMINGMVVSHQSFIPKKKIVPEFNLNYSCSADIDWVISCLKKANKVKNANQILSKYLIGGFSVKNQKRSWKERFQIYLYHYGYIKTIWTHVKIVIKNLGFLAENKKNY